MSYAPLRERVQDRRNRLSHLGVRGDMKDCRIDSVGLFHSTRVLKHEDVPG
jgi:hypothetical protein